MDATGTKTLTVFQQRIVVCRRRDVGNDARLSVVAIDAWWADVGILGVLVALGVGLLGIGSLAILAGPALVFVRRIIAHARLYEVAVTLHTEVVVVG